MSAARHGLGEQAVPVIVDASSTGVVLARSRFDRLSGFLARAVRDAVVTFEDPGGVLELERQWHAELTTCVRLEAMAVRTAEVLDGRGLRWLLTKGAALAHLDYPEPGLRTFGDVDLIVHAADWSETFRLLTAGGYHREAPTLPGRYDDRYGKGATLTTESLELDLHRRFAVGRFGVTVRMEALFTSPGSVRLADRHLPIPDTTGRLLHACFHATLGGFPGLRAFRDVAQLVLRSGADWQTAFDQARAWKAEAVVASAIREAWTRLELTTEHPAHDHAEAVSLSRSDRWVLDLFARGASFRTQALTAVPRLPPSDVPRYLWALSGARRRV